eukprot:CAMPEP_0119125342 /NCGR_PEP_ID=MMETSP1310-20130426/4650_1 /TAXON_ID=464262 /ORGANISM="Genus nov. species nov., Strain RCC2339" /LENGTH=374 /DNA_ID=CAMNT_0007115401 /DNA_START=165 /DNA_END=1286 /DNA_ORIENTATION=-
MVPSPAPFPSTSPTPAPSDLENGILSMGFIIFIAAFVGVVLLVFLTLLVCYFYKCRKANISDEGREYSLMHRASSTDDLYGNPHLGDLHDSASDYFVDDMVVVTGASDLQNANTMVKPPLSWTTSQLIPPSVRLVDVTEEMRQTVQELMDIFFLGDSQSGSSSFRIFKPGASETPIVLRVKRIENTALWRKYSLTRNLIREKGPYAHVSTAVNRSAPGRQLATMLGEDTGGEEGHRALCGDDSMVNDSLNEAILFHGTSPKYVKHIGHQGYDARVSSTSGNFGAGCYFTDDCRKSHQYAKCDGEKRFYLFVNRVLLGTTFTSDKAMKHLRRPPVDVVTSHLCDSVMGTITTYKEYVVYDNTQCYPDLLVIYKME